jgi:hypothetical protein
MELFKAEAASIRTLVEGWYNSQDTELEATFKGGKVDVTTFMAVAQRLRAKNYRAMPQEDHLNVITPEHVRFTLVTMPVIQAYCENDVMAGKAYEAVIKNRESVESQVDIDDYDVRIKHRKEIPMKYEEDAKLKEMFASWPQQRKAFRMIRRWCFEGDGFRIDMSIVRSTKRDKTGKFVWQSRFREQDIMTAQPTYEIEVELLRKAAGTGAGAEADSVEAAQKRLIRGIGEVLRGIQKHTILIRNSVQTRVLAAYKELTGSPLFRGPNLLTLLRSNFGNERIPGQANIRNGYNVTDKADGLRALGFVDEKGDLYLIDMSMTVYRTGLRRPELRLSLVDGEWVTKTIDVPPKPVQQFLLFDIFYATDKKDVSQYPFYYSKATAVPAGTGAGVPPPTPPETTRYEQLQAWTTLWNKGSGPEMVTAGLTAETKLQVAAKEFFFARAGDTTIFTHAAAKALQTAKSYYTDGLIFTPNASPLPKKSGDTFMEQFKWKPAKDNTIDFLVITEKVAGPKTKDKVTIGIKPYTNDTISYKTLNLFVGGFADNPRDIILNKKAIPKYDPDMTKKAGTRYKPVLFTPKEFPDPTAHICKLETHTDPETGEIYVMTEHSKEPIQSNTIVEMAYDPTRPEEWRWVPVRVRTDKTERYQRKILSRTLNADRTAENVWDSIYDPITESMIKTGNEEPQRSEIEALGKMALERDTIARKYYDRERPTIKKKVEIGEGLKKFHTRWIKEKILYKVGLSGEGRQLLDLACGVAGDLHIWRRLQAKFVFGVDNASKNILGTEDSAYTRYMNTIQDVGSPDMVLPMIFAIADSSKTLANGEAGKTDQESDILRAVLGKTDPKKPAELPPFIKDYGMNRLKAGADCISCMFAIHYMFEAKEKFQKFLGNIAENLKLGGYFIGCCFDGEKVFELLRGLEKGEAKTGIDKGDILWNITKQYDENEIPKGDDGFGLAIDVNFATIGMEHREYLVPFKLLEEQLALVGCELLTKDELKEFGMVNSTATFDVSWEMAKKKGTVYELGPIASEFSFLNRWFIFKRKRLVTMATAAIAEAEALTRGVGATGTTGAPTVATKGRAANIRNKAAMNSNAVALLQQIPSTAANGRTVPVEQEPTGKTYSPEEIFSFYPNAANKDILKIKVPDAGKWLSMNAPFQILDPDNTRIIYPSVEHFLAGMSVKYASNKTAIDINDAAETAASIFGREGVIHQRFVAQRAAEALTEAKPLKMVRDKELLKQESQSVRDEMRPESLASKYGIIIDQAMWLTKKDDFLEQALQQRWKRDKKFHEILEATRAQNKILLYYNPGALMNDLGGEFVPTTGRIIGDNKLGKMMMKIAGYPS